MISNDKIKSNCISQIILDQMLISPVTGLKLEKKELLYQSNNEEYLIINQIPILIVKEDLSKYEENLYKSDFIYFPFFDNSFVKSLKNKLQIQSDSLMLDLGGGEGFYSNCFNDLGINVITGDFSKYLLEKGKKNIPM